MNLGMFGEDQIMPECTCIANWSDLVSESCFAIPLDTRFDRFFLEENGEDGGVAIILLVGRT